jgi:hypothetical protein
MDTTIRLTSYGREMLEEHLSRGTPRSPEEVIERVLETLRKKNRIGSGAGLRPKPPLKPLLTLWKSRSGIVWADRR